MVPLGPLLLIACVARPPTALEAYALARRGELEEARAVAAQALTVYPGEAAAALFTAAAVEIEAGHLDAAGALVGRLAALPEPCPEARVLAALVSRRRSAPRERMTEALATSWLAAGHPDLRKGGVLKTLAEQRPPWRVFAQSESALLGSGRLEAYLLVPALSPRVQVVVDGQRRWAWVARRAGEAEFLISGESPSLATAVCAIGDLQDAAARRRVFAELERTHPENGLIALSAAMQAAADDAPLSAPELDQVERALAMRVFHWPLREVYLELVHHAGRLDDPHAQVLARRALAACLPVPYVPVALGRRAAATRDPVLRGRAIALANAVAARLASAPTLGERAMAEALAFIAADLVKDRPSKLAVASEAARQRRREDIAGGAMLDSWPFASLWREWDPEEEAAIVARLAP